DRHPGGLPGTHLRPLPPRTGRGAAGRGAGGFRHGGRPRGCQADRRRPRWSDLGRIAAGRRQPVLRATPRGRRAVRGEAPMSVPVLVVDDNRGFLHVVRNLFADTASPFAVHTVETGRDALAFLERHPPFADAPRPAFVVLDFRLP